MIFGFGIQDASSGGGGGGTVTSVNVSGGSSGLTFAGGPILTSGTISISGGVLLPSYGGTGAGALTTNSVVFIGASGVYSEANTNFNYNPSGGLTLRGVGTAAAAIQAMASGNTASNMAAYFASANEANLWIYRGDGINQLFGTYGLEHGSASGTINFNVSSSRTVMFNEGGPGATNIVTIAKEGVDIAGGWIKTQAPTGAASGAGRTKIGKIVSGTFATPVTERALEIQSEEGSLEYIQLVTPV